MNVIMQCHLLKFYRHADVRVVCGHRRSFGREEIKNVACGMSYARTISTIAGLVRGEECEMCIAITLANCRSNYEHNDTNTPSNRLQQRNDGRRIDVAHSKHKTTLPRHKFVWTMIEEFSRRQSTAVAMVVATARA